ncbi:epoxide hydrolase family protein [Streptomyces canus]|uniref:epoxide hydrolase family protein n=1 Tax=Streptomyces canus TaxID=58343 RepID=UPI0003A57AAD|nr:epoxide hydrolase family protein [Streptomyces canus]
MKKRTTSAIDFIPKIDPAVVEDLRARARATRWPDAHEDAGWSLGVELDYLRELVEYWADGFDFEAHRARLAALPGRRVEIDGIGIHFMHARAEAGSGSAAPIPLLLAHGWPDSSWRYRKAVPLLTRPAAQMGADAQVFDVVVPDMPGFGFSDRLIGKAPDVRAVAGMWAELMTALGYERFAVAGGDFGAHVVRYLALDFPDRVIGVHRMDGDLPTGDPATLTQEERDWIRDSQNWQAREGAYSAMHVTKPQTIAVGLMDSPAGLAAWVVEKLQSWSDCGGDLESVYTRDEILDLLTEYWVTGTIGSSIRSYRAMVEIPAEQLPRRVEVPSGFTMFPRDFKNAPRAWLERMTNLVHYSEPERGGHFVPFEEPDLYVQELRNFFGAGWL